MKNIFAVAGVVIKELYRRKDFYVLFILTVLICLVMASVNVFNDKQIVRYLKELCLLLIWISSLVIAITTTARQIPAEREQRTLLPLLAKPLTRTQLIFGKFLGCWLACGLVLLCFYVFFGALAASRDHHWPLLNYFQAACCTGSCWAWSSPWRCSVRWSLPRRLPTPPFASWLWAVFWSWAGIWIKWPSDLRTGAHHHTIPFILPFRIWNCSTCATW